MARVTAARAQAQKEGIDAKTLFFGLADARSKEGQRYLSQNSYIDARSAFVISEKLFRTGMEKGGDEGRLKAFRKYVENLREDIEDIGKGWGEDKTFKSARRTKNRERHPSQRRTLRARLSPISRLQLSIRRPCSPPNR